MINDTKDWLYDMEGMQIRGAIRKDCKIQMYNNHSNVKLYIIFEPVKDGENTRLEAGKC